MERSRLADAELSPSPDGYQSVEDFVAQRGREFPALYETPPPTPVEGSGRLMQIYDYWPAGTDGGSVNVKAIELERSSHPNLRAYLDIPLKPELLEYLRGLSRGERVTVSGIGHGDSKNVINIYPVHRLNGRVP